MTPRNEFAFDLKLTFSRRLDYASLSGQRGFASVSKGEITGPRIGGKIIGGGDWPVFRPDGVAEFDSRYFIDLGDDTYVYLRNQGIHRGTPEILEKLRAGEVPEPGSYYLACTPRFESAPGADDWLTKSIFFGYGTYRPDGIDFTCFEVL